jgi:nicotinamide-nucleotide amidase
MFNDDLRHEAHTLQSELRAAALSLAAAESCTGGLIMALMTEIPGSSDVIDRGFVTYSNAAKEECLGVNPDLIVNHGAVSEEVARAMAEGALVHSDADIAVAVTGVAGPGGGSVEKPVGLVHMAIARTGADTIHVPLRFGDVGRSKIRTQTVEAAIKVLREIVNSGTHR